MTTYTLSDLPVLKTRVMNGNQALWQAWQEAKALPETDYVQFLHNGLDVNFEKLDKLCVALMNLGYRQCLYTDGRPCYSDDQWFCFVCPKQKQVKVVLKDTLKGVS